MTRRIVLAILALICALLGTVVIPLGLITAEHDRQDFRSQAASAARSLASVAEEKVSDREGGRKLATTITQLRDYGGQSAGGGAGSVVVTQAAGIGAGSGGTGCDLERADHAQGNGKG